MKSLGKKIALVAVLVGSLAIPLTASAQTYVPPVAYSNFDAFLSRHPRDAQQLSRNPALANNAHWLEHHPHARDFFNSHSNVRYGLRTNPSQFMSSTQGWGNAWGHNTNVYNYMTQHPQVANELYRNPGLANDPEFLRRHPDFDHFTRNYPGASARFQQHWRYQHEHDWNHDHNQVLGQAYNQPGHGHHWAYGHDKQDNWKHGHHDNWKHGHDNWDHGHGHD